MDITAELSSKITRLSFVCALLVVAIHCTVGDVYHPVGAFSWCQTFVNRGLTRMAVPFFFMVFGFFLFKDFEFSFAWWKGKLINRAKTLLIPYWTWSLIGILNLALWNQFRKHPTLMDWNNFGWWMKALGITEAPIGSFVLWFVRVLLGVVIIAPLLGLAIKKLTWFVPVLFLGAQALGVSNYCGNFFYVSAGAVLAMFGNDVVEHKFGKKGYSFLLSMVWLLLIAFKIFVEIRGMNNFGTRMLCEITNSIGILFLWTTYDCVREDMKFLDAIAKSSFFLYCAHCLVGMFWQKPFIMMGLPEANPFVFFLVAYLGMVTIPVVAWLFLKKYAPRRVLLMLSGGR